MVNVQTGNMLDVVVEGKSIGLKQRDSDHRKHEVIWLPEPENLAMVLLTEIERLNPRRVNPPAAPDERDKQLAQELVGTVFDNTSASHDTLKRTMIERATDWLATVRAEAREAAFNEVKEAVRAVNIRSEKYPNRYASPAVVKSRAESAAASARTGKVEG